MRGFTLLEMTIVLSLLTILMPIAYEMQRGLAAGYQAANAKVQAAIATRTVSEQLRADRWTGDWRGAKGTTIKNADCKTINYRVTKNHTLVRQACGHTLALARNVASFNRTDLGVAITYNIPLSGRRSESLTFQIPLGGRP